MGMAAFQKQRSDYEGVPSVPLYEYITELSELNNIEIITSI